MDISKLLVVIDGMSTRLKGRTGHNWLKNGIRKWDQKHSQKNRRRKTAEG